MVGGPHAAGAGTARSATQQPAESSRTHAIVSMQYREAWEDASPGNGGNAAADRGLLVFLLVKPASQAPHDTSGGPEDLREAETWPYSLRRDKTLGTPGRVATRATPRRSAYDLVPRHKHTQSIHEQYPTLHYINYRVLAVFGEACGSAKACQTRPCSQRNDLRLDPPGQRSSRGCLAG